MGWAGPGWDATTDEGENPLSYMGHQETEAGPGGREQAQDTSARGGHPEPKLHQFSSRESLKTGRCTHKETSGTEEGLEVHVKREEVLNKV